MIIVVIFATKSYRLFITPINLIGFRNFDLIHFCCGHVQEGFRLGCKTVIGGTFDTQLIIKLVRQDAELGYQQLINHELEILKFRIFIFIGL